MDFLELSDHTLVNQALIESVYIVEVTETKKMAPSWRLVIRCLRRDYEEKFPTREEAMDFLIDHFLGAVE